MMACGQQQAVRQDSESTSMLSNLRYQHTVQRDSSALGVHT